MGSTTGYSGVSRAPAESRAIFKSALDETRQTTRTTESVRNVFISFHVDDEAQVNLLRAQAKSENFDLDFRDYSIKEPFDEAWKRNCSERIGQTSLTICMIGNETANRPAVIWELEESYRQGKKVIGVRISKDRNDPVPRPLVDHKASIVNWKIDEIRKHLDQ